MVVSAVQPLYNTYAPGAIANGSTANALYNYDQILQLQAEEALLEVGNTSSGSGSSLGSALGFADLLDLSPAALNILNGIETASSASGAAGISLTNTPTSTNLTLTGTLTGTTLTPAQQQQVASIVAQYAGAPLTQATFTQISSALTSAGINPQGLSIQQLLEAYAYAYTPAFAYTDELATDTLADDLLNA